MKHIIKKLALLFVPVYLWFAFFVAFEPNNYFGIKKTASSSQPVARVRAYEQSPGTNLIIGDSRLAHFDMDLVDSLTGQSWQKPFTSKAELADWCRENQPFYKKRITAVNNHFAKLYNLK